MELSKPSMCRLAHFLHGNYHETLQLKCFYIGPEMIEVSLTASWSLSAIMPMNGCKEGPYGIQNYGVASVVFLCCLWLIR